MSQKSIRPLPEGLIIGLVALVAIGVNVYWTYERAREALQGEIKEGLLRTVSATARLLDGRLGDEHRAFHPPERAGGAIIPADWWTTEGGKRVYAEWWKRLQSDKGFVSWRDETMATPTYRDWKVRMEEVRKATAHVRYLYTCVLQENHVYFAFNEVPQNDTANNVTGEGTPDGSPDPAPNLLWPYPDAGASQLKALTEGIACVDAEPYTDIWGTYYSGYAPFYDSKGQMVGTIGMDLELTGFNERIAPVIIASKRAAVTGLCVAILAGVVVWFVRRLCSQLWGRSGDGDGGRLDVAVLQNSKSAYAANLLQTLYIAPDASGQLSSLHRIVAAGRDASSDSRNNFRCDALVTLARDQAQILDYEIDVTLDPDLPEVLYAAAGRVSDAIVDCIEALVGPGLHLRFSMEDERINWLTLVARFTQPISTANAGPEGEMDLLAENRVELASALAHARALRGDLLATRRPDGIEVTLRIPLQKSKAPEAGGPQ